MWQKPDLPDSRGDLESECSNKGHCSRTQEIVFNLFNSTLSTKRHEVVTVVRQKCTVIILETCILSQNINIWYECINNVLREKRKMVSNCSSTLVLRVPWTNTHDSIENDPFIWIGCVGSGEHLKCTGHLAPRTRIERHCDIWRKWGLVYILFDCLMTHLW